MELIEGRTITGEQLAMDNKEFRHCTLIDCVLEYGGGDVVLDHTMLQGCRYVFFGPARGTVHFLQAVGLLDQNMQAWKEIPDHVN